MKVPRVLVLLLILIQLFSLNACFSNDAGTASGSLIAAPAKEVTEVTEAYVTQYLTVKNDGRDVPFVLVTPNGPQEYPLVVMLHGFGGSKDEGGGFTHIAEELAVQGIASVRMDFAGCGESTADFIDFNLENNISDANACLEYVLARGNIDEDRIGLFGYSMGGAAGVMLSEEPYHPFDAMVLLAPAAFSDDARITSSRDQLKSAMDNGGHNTIEWFGKSLNIGVEHYKDQLDFFTHVDTYDNTVPAIVIYGDKDTMVSPQNSISFAEQMDVESILIQGADHGYGFYSDQPEVTERLVNTTIGFFEETFDMGYNEIIVNIQRATHTIPSTVCIPKGEGPFPAVVMLHGTGSNRSEVGGGYDVAAPILAERYGIATIRIDFIGNGDSTSDYKEYDFTSATDDAFTALQYLASLSKIDPKRIGIMGWSQGGTMAMLTASKHPDTIQSVVTWAGALHLEGLWSEEEYATAERMGYFVKEYTWRTPLNYSLQWCKDVQATDVLQEFSKYSGPVLAIAGSQDQLVDPDQARLIAESSSHERSEYFIIDGMDHIFNVFTEKDLKSLHTAIDRTGEFFRSTL